MDVNGVNSLQNISFYVSWQKEIEYDMIMSECEYIFTKLLLKNVFTSSCGLLFKGALHFSTYCAK